MPPATPRPVVRDPDSKKRRILEAARRILIQRDFQDIVLDDVAKAAGVAKGTLFLYFKSKDELFSAAFVDLADGLALELEALGKAGLKGRELIAALARVILGHFDRNRDFIGRAGLGSMPGCGARSRGRLTEKFKRNHALARSLLEAASSDGGRSAPDLDFAASALFGLCRSVAVRRLLYGGDGPLEREADVVVGFFLDGSGVKP